MELRLGRVDLSQQENTLKHTLSLQNDDLKLRFLIER